MFQEDIFPDCISARPGCSADDWVSGTSAEPHRMSMDPDDRKDEDDSGGDVNFQAKKTYDEVVQENVQLKQKIKQLEDEIAALKASQGGGDGGDEAGGDYE